ncbi:MAG: DUF1553 domain-containing protein, partial [Gemmataceae bacterium]
DSTPVPTLLLSTPEQDQQLATLSEQVRQAEAEVVKFRKQAQPLQNRPRLAPRRGLVAEYRFDGEKAAFTSNRVDEKQPARLHENPTSVPGVRGQALAMQGDNGAEFPGVGHFRRSDRFSFSLWIRPTAESARAVVFHHSKAPTDAGSRGYELLLEQGQVAFGLHHMWPGNSLKVRTQAKLPLQQWSHLVVTYDGSSRADGVRLFMNGERAATTVVRDGLQKDIHYDGNEPGFAVGYRFRDTGFKGGAVDELQIYRVELTAYEIARLAGKNDIPASLWQDHSAQTTDAQLLIKQKQLDEIRRRAADFVNPIPEAMVMAELPTPRPAHILRRGQYDDLGDRVQPQTPAAFPPLPKSASPNRRGLTEWLTHPDHPLFARVQVNRLWQQMFGTGLVETSDNFGTTGSPPSHPALLDWLARDFARDWDIHRMLKQIALSDVYQRSSHTLPAQFALDPANKLLARGPGRRLTAEMLRDQSLAISGLLSEKLGGPSVYPYQPAGYWNDAMGRPHYPQSKGADLHRRSLYTVWKRTAPHPMLSVFDVPERSVCTARRQSTNTPLQALALLNDVQSVEAARHFGARLLAQPGPREQQLSWAFELATSRGPTPAELKVLGKLLAEQLTEYTRNPKAAEQLLKNGEAPTKSTASIPEQAAATIVALTLLNHDETVNRR